MVIVILQIRQLLLLILFITFLQFRFFILHLLFFNFSSLIYSLFIFFWHQHPVDIFDFGLLWIGIIFSWLGFFGAPPFPRIFLGFDFEGVLGIFIRLLGELLDVRLRLFERISCQLINLCLLNTHELNINVILLLLDLRSFSSPLLQVLSHLLPLLLSILYLLLFLNFNLLLFDDLLLLSQISFSFLLLLLFIHFH